MSILQFFFSFFIAHSLVPFSLFSMQQQPRVCSLLETCQDIQRYRLNDYSALYGIVTMGLGILTDSSVLTLAGGALLYLSLDSANNSLEKIFKEANRCSHLKRSRKKELL